MMNEFCPIVRDLLPSYVEGLCSNESQRFVENHFVECTECADECAAMKEQFATSTQSNTGDAAVLQSMRKTYRCIRLRTLAIAVVAAIFVFAGLAGAVHFYSYQEVPASSAEADLFSLAQAPEGRVYYTIASSQYSYAHYSLIPRMDADTNALYYSMLRSLRRAPLSPEEAEYEMFRADIQKNPWEAREMGAFVKDGRLYFEPNGEAIEVKSIYVGIKDDCRLVWQEGDEIPILPFDPEALRNEIGIG